MKITHRIIALLLCLLMVGSGSLMVLAEETGDDIVIIESEPCAECGAVDHLETCSQYVVSAPVICVECGLADGAHEETCPQYVAPAPEACAECGMEEGHADTCSQYVAPAPVICAECSLADGAHADTCSQYVAPAPIGCAECGLEEGHADTCSQYVPTLFEQLISAETVEAMYEIAVNADANDRIALVTAEINELFDLINTLDPNGSASATESMVDLLISLPNFVSNAEQDGEEGATLDAVPGSGEVKGNVTGTQFLAAKNSNNIVKLLDNTKLGTNNINVAKGTTLIIDLNGMVLQGIGSGAVINVEDGATLTIRDSNPTVGHGGNITEAGLWEWKTGNFNSGSKGGFIYNQGTGAGITVSGTLNMEGGTIAGCISTFGSAITGTSSAKITITGGRIIYNVATRASNTDSCAVIHSEKDHNNTGSFLNISNAEISNNTSSGLGGAINGYNVTLTNCTFSGNKAARGAAVSLYGNGTLTVSNCVFANNTATSYGGAIIANGTVELKDSTEITENSGTHGAGIFMSDNGSLEIVGCTVSDNVASNAGGGIYAGKNGSIVIEQSTISGNYAKINGGGIYTISGITITDSFITDNRAMETETGKNVVRNGRGGGLYITGDKNADEVNALIVGTEVSRNAAMYYGGGIQVCNGATLEWQTGSLSYNEAILHGAGAVHVTADATFTLTSGEISHNIAHSVGGGIHSSYTCTLNLNGGTISNNTVYGRGGGVHVNVGGNLLLNGTVIENNFAYNGQNCYAATVNEDLKTWSDVLATDFVDGYGGGVTVDSGTCTMTAGSLSGNYADAGGGGIAFVMINSAEGARLGENKVVSFDFQGGVISGNTTSGNGAGIYLMENTFTEEGLEAENNWTVDGNTITDNAGKTVTLKDASGATVNIQDIISAIPYVTISGGTLANNVADGDGGAAYLDQNTKFQISGGTVSNNSAVNGGAVYVEQGEAIINGGDFGKNEASENGGALYVNGNVSMTAGTLGGSAENRNTAENGGAVCVSGGTFTMSDGTISYNTSDENGGACYVATGHFSMTGGTIERNTASNGGAVYITGGNFDMISGKLLNNGTQSETDITEYGGAVYVDGGDITIGVEDCEGGDEGTKHTSTHKDKTHPIIKENKAQYGGAFAVRGTNDGEGNAITGNVTVFCSFITDNEADNEGTGHNIFMDGGGLKHYLNSAEIGTPQNHDIVSIGGQLQVVKDGQIIEIKLVYDANASAIEMQWVGKAPEGYHLNLPYCPKDWQETQAKPENGSKAFVGWSHVPTNSNLASEVRDKNDYLPIGTAIEVQGDDDNKMVFYAVWAPYTNNVSYGYSIDGENISAVNTLSTIGIATTTPAQYRTYNYDNVSYDFGLPTPNIPGYEFKGWVMYSDTAKISNWNADPENKLPSSQVTLVSQIDDIETKWTGKIDRNFGDITLVAVFIPQYTDLRIENTATGARDDQVFQFLITGTPDNKALGAYSMTVTIHGTDDVLVSQIPVGDYTVTQLNSWSWRYNNGANQTSAVVDLADPAKTGDNAITVSFTNTSYFTNWLSGDSFKLNLWNNN